MRARRKIRGLRGSPVEHAMDSVPYGKKAEQLFDEAVDLASSARSRSDCHKALDLSFQATRAAGHFFCLSGEADKETNQGIVNRPGADEAIEAFDTLHLQEMIDRLQRRPRDARVAVHACMIQDEFENPEGDGWSYGGGSLLDSEQPYGKLAGLRKRRRKVRRVNLGGRGPCLGGMCGHRRGLGAPAEEHVVEAGALAKKSMAVLGKAKAIALRAKSNVDCSRAYAELLVATEGQQRAECQAQMYVEAGGSAELPKAVRGKQLAYATERALVEIDRCHNRFAAPTPAAQRRTRKVMTS